MAWHMRAVRRSILAAQVLIPALVTQAAWAQADIPPAPATESLKLNHPVVVDTGHLQSGDVQVALFGVQGQGGDFAHSLQSFITVNGDRVACEPHGADQYTCMLPTGLDVAATALANGAARATPDAPAAYHEQEAAAEAARLGLWASLPVAPVAVENPVVQTTALLVAGGRAFPLDGLIGFNADFYTLQLQRYIASHGDRLDCQERGNTGRYVCLLPSGTDIATVALLDGLARASADASDAYRADQARAVADRSGIWFQPPAGDVAALAPSPPIAPCCTLQPGDSGLGLTYNEGLPTAIIDDEPVFFFFAGSLGFGFFDRLHHFRPAPPAIAAHLAQFHPNGTGLPGHGPALPATAASNFRPPGFVPPAVLAAPHVFRGADPAVASSDVTVHAPGFLPRVINLPGSPPRRLLEPRMLNPAGLGLRPLPQNTIPVMAPFQGTIAPRGLPRPGFRPGVAVGGLHPIGETPRLFAMPQPALLGHR